MGLRGLFLFFIAIIAIIFSLQNSQLIYLIFFGFKSLSLPLYLWIIIFILGGIISSLIIQLLSNSSASDKPSDIKQPSPSSYQNPPASFPHQYPNNQKKKVATSAVSQPSPEERQEAYYHQVNIESSTPENMVDEIEHISYTITEDELYTNEKQEEDDSDIFFDEENKQESETIIKNDTEESETVIDEEIQESATIIEEDKEEIVTKKWVVSSEDDIPSESFLKTREASLYSFKPREKTEIIPKSSSSSKSSNASQKRISSSSSSSQNINRGGVYDATYRVISPPRDDRKDNDDYDGEFFDDDDDWDF